MFAKFFGENILKIILINLNPLQVEMAQEMRRRIQLREANQVETIEISELEQACWHRSGKYFGRKNTL
jgi:hypothetical protein